MMSPNQGSFNEKQWEWTRIGENESASYRHFRVHRDRHKEGEQLCNSRSNARQGLVI